MPRLGIASLLALGAVGVCNWDLELVLVQDASTSYTKWFTPMMGSVADLIDKAESHFASVRFALTGFTDKPAPFRGVGNGRGYSHGSLDYCYRRMSSLTVDRENMINSYYDLGEVAGSGGDGPENPYEAMIYAALDDGIGYEPGNKDSTGRDRVRIMLITTDDVPHYSGDLKQGMEWWNGPDKTDVNAPPHFGDPEFIESGKYYINDSPAIYGGAAENGKNYKRFLELREDGAVDTSEYKQLEALLGPVTFNVTSIQDRTVQNHKQENNTSLATSQCATFEYPSVATVAQALKQRNIIPIFVVAKPPQITSESEATCTKRGYAINNSGNEEAQKDDFLSCLTSIYREDLKNAGVEDVRVITYEAGNTNSFVDNVIDTLQSVAGEKDCHFVPGVIPWISGAVVGVGILALCVPAFLAKKGEELLEEALDPEESTVSISMDEDSCSWKDYI